MAWSAMSRTPPSPPTPGSRLRCGSTPGRKAAAKAAARSAGGRGASASSRPVAADPKERVFHPVPPPAIPADIAESYLPPGATILNDFRENRWTIYGEQGAPNRVLAWAWHQNRDATGDECA